MDVSVRFGEQTCVVTVGCEDTVGSLITHAAQELHLSCDTAHLCIRTGDLCFDGKDNHKTRLAQTPLGEGSAVELYSTLPDVVATGYVCDGVSVALSASGARLAVGGHNGVMSVWDTSCAAFLWESDDFGEFDVEHVAFSPCETLIAMTRCEGTLLLLDTETGTLKHTLLCCGFANSICFSHCNNYIIAGADMLHIWDTTSGTHLHNRTGSIILKVVSIQDTIVAQDSAHNIITCKLGSWEQSKTQMPGTLSTCGTYVLNTEGCYVWDVVTKTKVVLPQTIPYGVVPVAKRLADIDPERREVRLWTALNVPGEGQGRVCTTLCWKKTPDSAFSRHVLSSCLRYIISIGSEVAVSTLELTENAESVCDGGLGFRG